ncbi:unnamed protein product [Blepharisma stoltei]|uniref:Uncharacterized protein n=1 Tax=Blepharisma stoltei TaxID=1481888 RepID=A0AAU9IGS9_9CILI|nr:unnamed protein product [Blepharisma stoltei]
MPMPNPDYLCNSTIFNGNILVSGHESKNIFIYSPDIDSFSTIPYNFEENTRKIFVNLEKLYLIECYGRIFESDIGDEYKWKRIASSVINYSAAQAYYSYNKGEIYIGCTGIHRSYYKFNLENKLMARK